MPTITKIAQQKRRPGRRNIYLDGQFAFGCHAKVAERFALCVGMDLQPQQIEIIQAGETVQECIEKALRFLSQRMHSRSELRLKLQRHDYPAQAIESALDQLATLGYVDDAKFALSKTAAAAKHKQHGPRRARMELLRAGVHADVAERAVREVYADGDSLAMARSLAQKHAPRLRRLDPQVARRRLVGLLQRRGFDYEAIRPILDEVLGDSNLDCDE